MCTCALEKDGVSPIFVVLYKYIVLKSFFSRLWSSGCRSRYQGVLGRLKFMKSPFCIIGESSSAYRGETERLSLLSLGVSARTHTHTHTCGAHIPKRADPQTLSRNEVSQRALHTARKIFLLLVHTLPLSLSLSLWAFLKGVGVGRGGIGAFSTLI